LELVDFIDIAYAPVCSFYRDFLKLRANVI
jgi:hypothetical protein